jgi:hypothetical protein
MRGGGRVAVRLELHLVGRPLLVARDQSEPLALPCCLSLCSTPNPLPSGHETTPSLGPNYGESGPKLARRLLHASQAVSHTFLLLLSVNTTTATSCQDLSMCPPASTSGHTARSKPRLTGRHADAKRYRGQPHNFGGETAVGSGSAPTDRLVHSSSCMCCTRSSFIRSAIARLLGSSPG